MIVSLGGWRRDCAEIQLCAVSGWCNSRMDVPAAERTWQYIEEWIARHAPRSHALLNPPASLAQLDAVTDTLGVNLPRDLRGWWAAVNGVRLERGGLIPDRCQPLSTDQALDRWRMQLQVQRDICPAGLVQAMERFVAAENRQPAGVLRADDVPHWLPRWLPVATDGGGGGYFADLRDGPRRGCLVRFHRDSMQPRARWESLTELWVDVADRLDSQLVDVEDGYLWID
jgi:cell wall assembly regulator SMI1